MVGLMLSVVVACGGDDAEPYTWGDVSVELSAMYCQAVADCGFMSQKGVELCVEHSAWHMCEPDMSCSVEVDERLASEYLVTCEAALQPLYLDNPDPDAQFSCYLLGYYGLVPEGCGPVFELDPGPQEPQQ